MPVRPSGPSKSRHSTSAVHLARIPRQFRPDLRRIALPSAVPAYQTIWSWFPFSQLELIPAGARTPPTDQAVLFAPFEIAIALVEAANQKPHPPGHAPQRIRFRQTTPCSAAVRRRFGP